MAEGVLVDVAAAGRAVRRPKTTVYYWLKKGWLTRHGKDERGRMLVNLSEVVAVAATSVSHSDVKPSGACTVQRRGAFEPCAAPVDEDLPWKVCPRHARAIADEVAGR